MARRLKRAPAKPRPRAIKKPRVAPLRKRRPTGQLFTVLDRVRQQAADEKIHGLLLVLRVHAEEMLARNEQLKEAKAELEQARDRYADLYDFAPIGYLLLNRSGLITDINLAGAALIGQKRKLLDRLPLFVVVHPSSRLRFRAFLKECWAKPDGPQHTIELDTDSSPPRILRLTGRAQKTGGTSRLLIAVTDMTDERRVGMERAVALERVTALLTRLVHVQEEERSRMARNLHDHLGQQFTALRFALDSLEDRRITDAEFRERLKRADLLAEGIDKDVGFLAWELRPPALAESGLNDALVQHLREWTAASGIPVEFHGTFPGATRLPPDIDTQLYRIVQEALQNVRKHSKAKTVSVLMEQRGAEVVLIVEDDGHGFDPDSTSRGDQEGMGLMSMRERATLVGGSLQIESSPADGTTVFVRVPLSKDPLL